MTLLSVMHPPLATRDAAVAQSNYQNSVIISAFILTTVLKILLPGLFAAFLWFKSGWMAKKIAAAPFVETELPGSHDFQRILLMMLGVLVLALAVPEAGHAIARGLLASSDPGGRASSISEIAADNWELLLQFLIGLGLIFGAPVLSRSLNALSSQEASSPVQAVERKEAG